MDRQDSEHYQAALLLLRDCPNNEYSDPEGILLIEKNDIGNIDSIDNKVAVYYNNIEVLCASRGKLYNYQADPEGWERDLLNLAERKKKKCALFE